MSFGSFGTVFASGWGLLRLGGLAGSGRLAAVNGHSGARAAVATAGKEGSGAHPRARGVWTGGRSVHASAWRELPFLRLLKK